MKRVEVIRAVAIFALLLPGLVVAAPIAGPCGLCGDGDSCHMQRLAEPEADAHSCCESSEEQESPEPSLASSNCECGRDAPSALITDAPAPVEVASAESATAEMVDPASAGGSGAALSARPPAPPPAPPAYLIDCAFLT